MKSHQLQLSINSVYCFYLSNPLFNKAAIVTIIDQNMNLLLRSSLKKLLSYLDNQYINRLTGLGLGLMTQD